MSQDNSNSFQDTQEQPRFPSLKLIFDLTKERLASQLDQIKNLDSKANFILGAATALVSAALVLQAAIITAQSSPPSTQSTPVPIYVVPLPAQSTPVPIYVTPHPVTPTPNPTSETSSSPFYCSMPRTKILPLSLLVFFTMYLAVIITAFFAYKLRTYKQTPNPEELRKTYLEKKENVTKEEIFTKMVDDYGHHNVVINSKVFWLKRSFVVLVCEAITLVLVLYVQSTC